MLKIKRKNSEQRDEKLDLKKRKEELLEPVKITRQNATWDIPIPLPIVRQKAFYIKND